MLVLRHASAMCWLAALATSALAAGAPQPATPTHNPPPGQQQVLALQTHLNAMQAQAQRQLGHLNGLMMSAANLTTGPSNGNRYYNVLDTLSSVGKAIQQQISAASGHVHIVTSAGAQPPGEPANSKKNEYQPIGAGEAGAGASARQQPAAANDTNWPASSNYREQGEQLRQEIVRRAGQLQQVVASSMDVMKNSGDMIVKRLLEQMNARLDQAKSKADRIVSEPATNEVAVKALAAINLGLNNLNNIITNIVTRLDLATKEASGAHRLATGAASQGPAPIVAPLLDTNKLKVNLHQLGQQFQTALNGSQLHQQLMTTMRQHQLVAQPNQTGEPAAGSATS